MAFFSKSWYPNAFTFSNVGSGVLSIIMVIQGNYLWAGIFILLAALADRYDGKVARYFKIDSELGKQLDSLADVISFGMAPAILSFQMHNYLAWGFFGYALVMLFPLCGAYRLARFNVTKFDGAFFGIPITFAGLFMALYCLATLYYPLPLAVTAVLVVVLSYLMVCTHRFHKF